MEKSADAFRTISEVADELKLPQHVLRFWETRFPQVKPMKRGGNRRFYRPDDVELLRAIKTLLYGDGFTIKGVQRILKERGPRAVASLALSPGRHAAERDPRRPLIPLAEDFEDGETTLAEAEAFDTEDAKAEPDLAPPIDVVEGLNTILFELAECRRILTAARG